MWRERCRSSAAEWGGRIECTACTLPHFRLFELWKRFGRLWGMCSNWRLQNSSASDRHRSSTRELCESAQIENFNVKKMLTKDECKSKAKLGSLRGLNGVCPKHLLAQNGLQTMYMKNTWFLSGSLLTDRLWQRKDSQKKSPLIILMLTAWNCSMNNRSAWLQNNSSFEVRNSNHSCLAWVWPPNERITI